MKKNKKLITQKQLDFLSLFNRSVHYGCTKEEAADIITDSISQLRALSSRFIIDNNYNIIFDGIRINPYDLKRW